MGGGGGRGGRKILDWPEGVFPRRAIGHPIVSSLWSDPTDALSPRMGFCAPMIFPESCIGLDSIEEGLARRGVPP